VKAKKKNSAIYLAIATQEKPQTLLWRLNRRSVVSGKIFNSKGNPRWGGERQRKIFRPQGLYNLKRQQYLSLCPAEIGSGI